jgi:spermidine synthase
MTADRPRFFGRKAVWLVALTGLAIGLWFAVDSLHQVGQGGGDRHGKIEREIRSKYSKIRIRRLDNVRTLGFVRDSGEEVIESMVNLEAPHDLIVDYTRFMFLSYLFRPKQEKVLIVGLGGGSMVHFLKHYDSKVKVDAVEIDPVIVDVADKYFGVRSGGNVEIITEDAFVYLRTTEKKYDVIYMDAFLKPSRDTDKTGIPLRLKTVRFYKEVQTKLTPNGCVVFNLNPHVEIERDIRLLREAFPQVYVYHLPDYGGLVVVGSTAPKRIAPATLNADAAELDRRFRTTYSFAAMARRLRR